MSEPTAEAEEASRFVPVYGKYALVLHIPLFKDADGGLYADSLWAKDLRLHARYIDDLTLVCPVIDGPPPEGTVPLEMPTLSVIALQPNIGWPRTVANILPTYRTMARVAESHDIIHVGTAGFPFPPGFYFLPLKKRRDFRLLTLIQSTPWADGGKRERRLHARLFDRLVARLLQISDLRIYTHSGFRARYGRPAEEGFINPACWIDPTFVAPEDLIRTRETRLGTGPLNMLFAGRLTREKGSDLVAQLAETWPAGAPEVHLTVIGEGAYRETFQRLAAKDALPIRLTVQEPVPYGGPFLEVLDKADILLMPTLTNEQPRLIFDAAARGLPVIASDTPGNRDLLGQGEGILIPQGDPSALLNACVSAVSSPKGLANIGRKAWQNHGHRSHEKMHQERSAYIADGLT